MKYPDEEVVIINMLKQAVESEGCKLAEVDFETRTLKIDGPDEVLANCARAAADIIE
jgi:hypothetical protein